LQFNKTKVNPGLSMFSAINETEFCESIRARNHQAFNHLYDNYSPALYGEILHIVNHKELAEDILQEVFIRIYQHAEDYDPKKGRLFTWMITIARNKCIDYLRSASHRETRLDVPITENNGKQQSTSISSLEFKMVYKRMETMFPGSLKIIELLYVHGYTHDEAAAICKLPVGTLKTRVRKVISNFRQSFQLS
jgi:RNA polymerase sigma factor (sigma-70 family)